jgi:hypothetical protein
MVGRLRKGVSERPGRGESTVGNAPGARVPDGRIQSGAGSPARPSARRGRLKELKPWTLGVGLAALLALVFAAVVAVMVLREQRRAPDYAGVFDAQPLQDMGADQSHEATKPESRDEGTAGLAEIPSASQSTASVLPAALANEANRSILGLLPSMPSGGGSEANAKSIRDLEEAIQVQEDQLKITPAAAQTTYSSGATYLVFLQALQSLLPPGTLSGSVAEALRVKAQPDGVGVWGRWNANGPGIACLFDELQLGPNFTSFDDAQAGDFVKAFFADAVGRREHSLSMIYLGREQQNGMEVVRVWSSIKPFGYGEAVIPRARISFAIFSRLEKPANIAQAPRLAYKNKYLASLLITDSSKEEAMAKSGVR